MKKVIGVIMVLALLVVGTGGYPKVDNTVIQKAIKPGEGGIGGN